MMDHSVDLGDGTRGANSQTVAEMIPCGVARRVEPLAVTREHCAAGLMDSLIDSRSIPSRSPRSQSALVRRPTGCARACDSSFSVGGRVLPRLPKGRRTITMFPAVTPRRRRSRRRTRTPPRLRRNGHTRMEWRLARTRSLQAEPGIAFENAGQVLESRASRGRRESCDSASQPVAAGFDTFGQGQGGSQGDPSLGNGERDRSTSPRSQSGWRRATVQRGQPAAPSRRRTPRRCCSGAVASSSTAVFGVDVRCGCSAIAVELTERRSPNWACGRRSATASSWPSPAVRASIGPALWVVSVGDIGRLTRTRRDVLWGRVCADRDCGRRPPDGGSWSGPVIRGVAMCEWPASRPDTMAS